MTLYNDNDKFCCQWLRNLVSAGHLPVGRVECEDIRKLDASTLPETCHFFAGIGGWPLALKLAGWTEPVWTGSCPCQPLSCAGRRKGHADERHLWPAFYSLIAKCRPATVFGEQVAGKDGREWLAGVRADLEGIGYAVGSANLCAAGVSSPQMRQRLYWVASATTTGRRQGFAKACSCSDKNRTELSGKTIDGLGRSNGAGFDSREQTCATLGHGHSVESASGIVGLESAGSNGWKTKANNQHDSKAVEERPANRTRRTSDNFWSEFSVIPVGTECKRISSEPGSFPLAHGVPARVGRLRAYGNAIVVPLAVEFIKAVMEI